MCDDIFPDSAQGLGIFTNSYKPVCCNATRSIEKSSLSVSGKLAAGMTVEAALVLPLFLFFLLNIGSIMEMIRFHGNVQLALWDVGNRAAVYAYALEKDVEAEERAEEEASDKGAKENEEDKEGDDDAWWEEFAGAALTGTFFKWLLVESLGEEYLESSPAVGGVDALFLWEGDFVKENGELELVVTYGAKPLFDIPGLPYFRMVNRYYGHTWTGYQCSPAANEIAAKVVFLAENGQVYHLYRECTHLTLSIREIWEAEVGAARNLYGGRYNACEKCVYGAKPSRLFVAMEGDCFHYVRECPGLKRTVYTVSALEVQTLPLCSRCKERKETEE